MSLNSFRQKIKPWMLPIAMLTGLIFYQYIHYVSFLSPCLIFVMLLITFCRLKISDFHIGPYIWLLLGVQLAGSTAIYFAIRPFNELIAQGAFICVFCPTATAAPTITGMLGGSISKVATYSLFSQVSVAILAPSLLSYMNPGAGITFAESMTRISVMVLPLILGPLVIALVMERTVPRVHHAIASHQGLSFYIWALALIIVVGNSVSFLVPRFRQNLWLILILAVVAFVACIIQFWLGRKIGRHYGDMISGAQSLGQKNTVLAVWLALNYLNPLVSAAPAAYVAWHNIVNSWQIYLYERQKQKSDHAAS